MVAIEDKSTPTIIYPPPEVNNTSQGIVLLTRASLKVCVFQLGAEYCGQNCWFCCSQRS
jgi:hypothetical protein